MNKYVIFIVLLLFQSCTSNDNSGTVTLPDALPGAISVPNGIYGGTVISREGRPDSAIGFITSNGDFTFINKGTLEVFKGRLAGGNLSGIVYSDSIANLTGRVTSASTCNINGTYTSSIASGTFALEAYTNLYNKQSSLSKLDGVWVDSVFTDDLGVTTWVIHVDGTYKMTTTAGCIGEGDFTNMNSSTNEYYLNMHISNCLENDGTYNGIGVVSDTYSTDDTISIVLNNESMAFLFEPIRQ